MIQVESPANDPTLCIGYRFLNAKTQVGIFLLPNIEQAEKKMTATSFILMMDLVIQKTVLETCAKISDVYDCQKTMLFGLLNVPFYF